jgi:hypothetical protein
MQEEYPVGGWSMSDSVYQEFCDVRDMITVAKFRTEFENELFTLDGECYKEGTDREGCVKNIYYYADDTCRELKCIIKREGAINHEKADTVCSNYSAAMRYVHGLQRLR